MRVRLVVESFEARYFECGSHMIELECEVASAYESEIKAEGESVKLVDDQGFTYN